MILKEGFIDFETNCLDMIQERRKKYPVFQLINLIEHVVDQLNLVGDLRASQDGQKRPWWVVQSLVEVGQLFLEEET